MHPYQDADYIRREHAKQKARFCLATGVSPSEYDKLTMEEVAAFIEEVNRRNG